MVQFHCRCPRDPDPTLGLSAREKGHWKHWSIFLVFVHHHVIHAPIRAYAKWWSQQKPIQIITWLLSLQNQESVPMSPDPFLLACVVEAGSETAYRYMALLITIYLFSLYRTCHKSFGQPQACNELVITWTSCVMMCRCMCGNVACACINLAIIIILCYDIRHVTILSKQMPNTTA